MKIINQGVRLMKRIAALTAAGALALGALAGTAAAQQGGNAHGKVIKNACGSYGQAVSAGKQLANQGLHPSFQPSGAAFFAQNYLGDCHPPLPNG